MDTTITFRTDEEIKRQASELFDSLGMTLSTALNIFMRQAIAQRRFPCSVDYEIAENYKGTYPQGFFDLFGTGAGLGLDEEPEELESEDKEINL